MTAKPRKKKPEPDTQKPRKRYPVHAEQRDPACPVVKKSVERHGSKYPLHHDPLDFEIDKASLSPAPYRPPVRKLQHDFKKDLEEVKRLLSEAQSGNVSLDYVRGYVEHALTEE